MFLLLVSAIVYGFHYRLEKQQARKNQQQSQRVASDAAQSNRRSVEGEMPVSSLPASGTTTTNPVPSITTPLVNAARTVAQPFPSAANAPASQSAQTPAAPVYYAPETAPQVDPQEELRKQALAHRYARQQEALEAPTGAQDQHTAPTISDPVQADVAQLNSLLHPATGVPSQAPVIGAPAPALPPAGLESASGYRAQNAQSEKRQFQEGGEAPEDDYLKSTRTPPLSPWVVQRGTVIPAALRIVWCPTCRAI